MAAQNEESKSAKPQPGEGGESRSGAEDAITLLKNDHRKVEQLFEAYGKATRRSEKEKLVKQICQELIIHTTLEEEIFYPACREHVDDDPLDEAQVEHDSAKVLINELFAATADQPFYDAKVKVLSEQIKHHVNEEEKRNEGIFAKAKAGGVDTDDIKDRLVERKAALMAEAQRQGPERPQSRSFTRRLDAAGPQERNGRGRDPDGSLARGSRQDPYGEEDDGRRRQGRMPERDSYGRFVSDDDDDQQRYGMRRRDDEDDDDEDRPRRNGRRFGTAGNGRTARDSGRPEDRDVYPRRDWEQPERHGGGWRGDPEGHADAARRGWENRGASRRGRDAEEDDRRGSPQRRRRDY